MLLLMAGVFAAWAQASPSAGCTDSQGGAYGRGAVLTVNGQRMRCADGVWKPLDAGADVTGSKVLDIGDADIAAAEEEKLLKRLRGQPLPPLECDRLLNSDRPVPPLLRPAPGHHVVLNFWTTWCGSCKPLLGELAALARKDPGRLSFLGVVQADAGSAPAPEAQRQKVAAIMKEHQVGFPTCVHFSPTVTRAWQAEGVPLTLVLSSDGVARVAMGGRNGRRLLAELTAAPHRP